MKPDPNRLREISAQGDKRLAKVIKKRVEKAYRKIVRAAQRGDYSVRLTIFFVHSLSLIGNIKTCWQNTLVNVGLR